MYKIALSDTWHRDEQYFLALNRDVNFEIKCLTKGSRTAENLT